MPHALGRTFGARIGFLGAFLRRPHQVASIAPSSRFLERRIVAFADLARARTVVELGPGAGGTTRAVLRELPPSARLLAIEIVPRFARALRQLGDSRLIVHEGSATRFQSVLANYQAPAPDVVVSGIPFSTIELTEARRLVAQIHASLAPGGRFVVYQLRDHVDTLAQQHFGPADKVREFRNLPPLTVYRWQKRTHDASR